MKKIIIFTLILAIINPLFAAKLVDLRHQPTSYLQQFLSIQFKANSMQPKLSKVRSYLDFNHTTHVRLQQTYLGYRVYGATAVTHQSKSKLHLTMNGLIYENLEKDLANVPPFNETQRNHALDQAESNYRATSHAAGKIYSQKNIEPIIFIDDNTIAHYAYLVSFYSDDGKTGPHRPTMILDAHSLFTYRQWDQVSHLKTDQPEPTVGGGIGGNEKIGSIIYDGSATNWPVLSLLRWVHANNNADCFLKSDNISVLDVAYENKISSGSCPLLPSHPNLPWLSVDENGSRWKFDETNGAYSPSLDALFGAIVIKNLYQEWYGIPILTKDDGKPMDLILKVHYGRNYANANWTGDAAIFGDGDAKTYPQPSLDVVAHEFSHGFTQQHSGIDFFKVQMGALFESFSDMAAAAAQFYAKGKSTWDFGRSIVKGQGALRYLDEPTKDGISIDNMKDYNDHTDPYALAGVFNKAFYLIAQTPGWDIHKAFDIMVKANMHYWTYSMDTLKEAACGVISATEDYNKNDSTYSVDDVKRAFIKVGIDTKDC